MRLLDVRHYFLGAPGRALYMECTLGFRPSLIISNLNAGFIVLLSFCYYDDIAENTQCEFLSFLFQANPCLLSHKIYEQS